MTFKNFSGAIIAQDCQSTFFLFVIENEELKKEYELDSCTYVEASCEAMRILKFKKLKHLIIDFDNEYSQYLQVIRKDQVSRLDNLDEIDPVELLYEDAEEDSEDEEEED